MANLQMQGFAELRETLRNLPDKLVKRIVRGAWRTSANLIKAEAVARVPSDTGALKASIRVVSRRGTSTRVVFQVVAGGDLSSAKQGKFGIRAPFYAQFVERGTVKMAARPFMRPALEAKGQAAIDQLAAEIGKRLGAIVK